MTAVLAAAFAFVKGDWRLLLLLALAAGAASEVARQNAGSLDAHRERVVIDEKLDRTTIEDLCRRAGGGGGCSGLQLGGRPTR
ncbi:exported hypothetical protein [uncultured Pleomorphomonas sp.]|uniref:Uncharacterized protein n=1 Tax=uncultured Pleomorphomonas sp. TaxID=442121 RepID=A0A212L9M9_9HYPH|nr:hypothetical protein [uncultured Pleomorphomonas sp.]SCM74029.1 exported hypothetical protein [uncultured Pleomorphomonas sp.]